MRRAKAVADLRKMATEAGVGGKVDNATGLFDDEAAPKSAIAVGEAAGGKVGGGDGMNDEVQSREGIAPIEFVHGFDVLRVE